MNIITRILFFVIGIKLFFDFFIVCNEANSLFTLLIFGCVLLTKSMRRFLIDMINLENSKNKCEKYINYDEIDDYLKKVYEKLKEKNFQELEALKINVRKYFVLELISGILMFSALIIFFVSEKYMLIESVRKFICFCYFLSFSSMLLYIASRVTKSLYRDDYIEIYKSEVIVYFVKMINRDYIYNFKRNEHKKIYKHSKEKTFVEQEYMNADFDGKKFSYLDEEDWIQGKIKENTFRMTDIKAIQEKKISKSIDKKVNVFEGMFFYCKSEIDINTCLKININKNNSIYGAKKYQITMDSTEFENLFDIYCEDKILGMRILTPDIMELIIDFYKKYYIPFEICYRNNKIYIRFFVKNMFEPKILGETMDRKKLYMYYNILNFSIKFSKEISKLTNIEL